jgi:phosphoribosylformylglycinamidine synthase subunit PurQ / glutaminase
VKNNEGAWYGDPESARVVLRYRGENALGSVDRVAGVASAAGNVLGLMPHPEEACDRLLGSTDGARLLRALAA